MFLANATVLIWSMTNLLILILIIAGIVFTVTAIWRIMKAQETIAKSMQELITIIKNKESNENK